MLGDVTPIVIKIFGYYVEPLYIPKLSVRYGTLPIMFVAN